MCNPKILALKSLYFEKVTKRLSSALIIHYKHVIVIDQKTCKMPGMYIYINANNFSTITTGDILIQDGIPDFDMLTSNAFKVLPTKSAISFGSIKYPGTRNVSPYQTVHFCPGTGRFFLHHNKVCIMHWAGQQSNSFSGFQVISRHA
ncbi:hypothetical protein HDC90_004604 [Pedobacter sp. AK013]|uniref:hypothetical protein n=1 Tax=Pedobacter sp. AK013 TaxID=2723071 RepID=UPI001619F15A|nr:hypothetical protein [Pedobacter sp. AK013]MBB6239942.1 hypothetical protein [Pedobacter sp. AK013]